MTAPCTRSISTSAATSAESAACETRFAVRDYDLAATLDCGQAFRWKQSNGRWSAVVSGRWVELWRDAKYIFARTAAPQSDWRWLENYLQLPVDLAAVLATFPDDEPMRRAAAACRGLRLLRQEPWECLASFILSSTKQIVQIRQIVATLCARHGSSALSLGEPAFAFPTPAQIAALNEDRLRECKMGFRAPNLLTAARLIDSGKLDLGGIPELELAEARARLVALRGVGPKIADCVLLFGFGFPTAFPVDVWVVKALRRFYFRNRRVSLPKLRQFSATHFGPHGGYAQQYLFHSIRRDERKNFRPAPARL
ncbi:MAG: DNA-3-methyladenine glycosylase 2 family protein [Pedosphaera sp.]|nr:DNA-3-methyladenine glycosylase 2 family protein [Pedosphaera sp.]